MDQNGLRWGAFVPQGSNLEYAGWNAADAWKRSIEIARTAAALGYNHLWVYDRVDTQPRREKEIVFESWILLSELARATSRGSTQLGNLLACAPYHNPGLLAKQAACIDVISGGRLLLGFDAGAHPSGYESYGLADPGEQGRVEALAEQMDAIRALWSEERTNFAGRHVNLKSAHCFPKPVHKQIPMWVVGNRVPGSLEVAARSGDAVIWEGGPDDVAEGMERVGEEYERAGRNGAGPTGVALVECRIFDDNIARDQWLGSPGERVFWSSHPDVYCRDNLVGTPEAVARRVQRYVDAGVREMVVWFRDYPDTTSLERFATEVMPQVSVLAPHEA